MNIVKKQSGSEFFGHLDHMREIMAGLGWIYHWNRGIIGNQGDIGSSCQRYGFEIVRSHVFNCMVCVSGFLH